MPVQFPIELNEQGHVNKMQSFTFNAREIIFGGENWVNDPLGSFASIWTGAAWGIDHNGKPVDITAPPGEAGLWVAVGDSGQIGYSLDGLTWVLAVSPFTGILRDVTYDSVNDRWLIVGEDVTGQVAYSDDGINWTNTGFTSASGIFRKVAHNGEVPGRWIAVGGNSDIYVSDDAGLTWTVKVAPAVNILLRNILYDNLAELKQWVIAGDKQTLWRSVDDGETWTVTVVAGATNSDNFEGLGWNKQAGANSSYAISTESAPTKIWHSDDAETWNIAEEPSGHQTGLGTGLKHIDGVFILHSVTGEISLSSFGDNWSPVNSNVIFALRDVAYDGASRMVAIGNSNAMTTSLTSNKSLTTIDLGDTYVYNEMHYINELEMEMFLVPEEFNGDVSKGVFLHGKVDDPHSTGNVQRTRMKGKWNFAKEDGFPHVNTTIRLEFRGGGK